MARQVRPPVARKTRADAARNRSRILAAAKTVFTRSGAAASLDEIARLAGVGPGTLYRHFPARQDLLKAVFQAGADNLTGAGREFSATLSPVEALRAWLLLFVDHLAQKQIIAPALTALEGDPQKLFKASYAQIWETVGTLVLRAVRSGDLRDDLDPVDLLRALVGVATVGPGTGWEQSANRLVDILIAGLKK